MFVRMFIFERREKVQNKSELGMLNPAFCIVKDGIGLLVNTSAANLLCPRMKLTQMRRTSHHCNVNRINVIRPLSNCAVQQKPCVIIELKSGPLLFFQPINLLFNYNVMDHAYADCCSPVVKRYICMW